MMKFPQHAKSGAQRKESTKELAPEIYIYIYRYCFIDEVLLSFLNKKAKYSLNCFFI